MSRFSLRTVRRAGMFAAAAWALAANSAQAGVVLSGGGLVLAEQGGTFAPDNLAAAAAGAIPFSSSDLGPELGIPFHRAVNLNDGVYGNSNSWIGGATSAPYPLPFAGVSLDGSATLSSIAFGRDNLGAFGDRSLGVYTLQYTTAADPSASTADASWTTIGTLNYQSAGGANFSSSTLRHRYNFTPVDNVTGVRLLVPGTGIGGGGTAIDEIELYQTPGAVVPPPPNVILTPSAGYAIGYDGNNGLFSTTASPALAPSNLASASNGAIPFGSTELGPALGIPFHRFVNINDGEYGNSKSWISDFTVGDPAPFIGVAFDGYVDMTSVAWGRDNGNVAGDCCGGTLTDRSMGLYGLQYTQIASPDAATPVTGDPMTGWADIGTVNYVASEAGVFDPYLRHEFTIAQGGNPVLASGLRLRVPDMQTAIDELEVYGVGAPPPPPPPKVVLTPAPGFGIGFNGNNGLHSTPDDPALVPDNLALASNGAIPFANTALGPQIGSSPTHDIATINDGQYGNRNSWIGGDDVASAFIGVAFDGAMNITSVAWGRDNGNVTGDACGGTCTDRALGVYTMQYTQVANPDANTGETGDPTTGWATIGSVDIRMAEAGVFDPHLRHEFTIGQGAGLDAIMATGFRLKVPATGLGGGTAIDELEVYGSAAIPEPSTAILAGIGLIGLAVLRRRRA